MSPGVPYFDDDDPTTPPWLKGRTPPFIDPQQAAMINSQPVGPTLNTPPTTPTGQVPIAKPKPSPIPSVETGQIPAPPVPPKPGVLQRIAAGAAGFGAGYSNAAGRSRQPIDVQGLQNKILYPGAGRAQAQYESQRQQQMDQAAIEKEKAATEETKAHSEWFKTQANEGKGQYLRVGDGVFDQKAGQWVAQPTSKVNQIQVDPAWAKQNMPALKPDAQGQVWIPVQAAGTLLKTELTPAKEQPLEEQLLDAQALKAAQQAGIIVDESKPIFPQVRKANPNLAVDVMNNYRQGKAPASRPITHIETDDKGQGTLVSVDPASGEVKKTPLGAIGKTKTENIGAPGSTPNDPKDIAQGIMSGLQPPTLTGLYRNAGPVRAELARNGYDLMTATRDWQAISRHLSTLNGVQQERLRQAITFTHDSIGQIEQLYGEWQKTGLPSGFKDFNRAALVAATHLPGNQGAVAQNLLTQLNDLTSELGTVYKGGNSSTDESLRLAAENLKADWNKETFARAVKQLKINLTIRKNSILTSTPVGVSPNSPYLPPRAPQEQAPAQPQAAPQRAPQGAAKAIPRAMVQKYADEHQVDFATAAKVFTDKQYQIQ